MKFSFLSCPWTHLKLMDLMGSQLKGTACSIAPYLTKLFSDPLAMHGHFPECWKTSSVVQILKSASHSELTNYRPISLLSIVSKMLEHQFIINYLNECHPLSNKKWNRLILFLVGH